MKKTQFLCFVLVCLSLSRPAEAAPLKISGYYKSLASFTKSVASEEDISGVINRLRLEIKKEMEPWTFYAAFDNEAIVHDFQNTPEFASIRSLTQNHTASWDWDKVSADGHHLYAKHSIYRAYVQYYDPKFQVTVGKQGIDWGVMRFYSPNDIFNMPGALSLEHDERPGVDGVKINWSPDDFTGLTAVVVPDKDKKDFMGALKAYKTINTYDFAMLAAMVRGNFLAGLTFDGYLKKAGLRGELQYADMDDGRQFFRGSVGIDYSFSRKFYVLFEQFYNGGAGGSYSTLSESYLSALEYLSVKKNLSSLWLQYKITPLLEWNNYIIYDWDGKSVIYNPELKYNVSDNVELKVGVQAAFGRNNSEFGSLQNLFYVQVQWFF